MIFKSVIDLIKNLEDKIDAQHKDVDNRLDAIEKVTLLQERNLDEHMKRSDNLEKLISRLEEKDLKPVVRHVAMVEGGLKLLGVIGIVVGIAGGLAKLFGAI